MDISALLMPGAQGLATAMLSDAWTATRDAIARLWGRGNHDDAAEASRELEDSRTRALELFSASDGDRQALVQAFLAGYLAALGRTDPERVEALTSVVSDPQPVEGTAKVGNLNQGRVDKLVQIDGNVRGGVHM